jgi:hypothetical protein
MTRRAASVAAVLTAVLLGGCGSGDSENRGGLRWSESPRVIRHPTLRQDRILTGTVRNDGTRTLEVRSGAVRLLDADGRRVQGTAAFVRGYLHSIYPPNRPPPGGVPERELLRTGRLLRLAPGDRSPLTLSWRIPAGAKPPVRVDYGGGSLPIPSD